MYADLCHPRKASDYLPGEEEPIASIDMTRSA
jgi:hypothetical protein